MLFSASILVDAFVKTLNYWDVFLGESSFYLALEFVLSFSSRSCHSVGIYTKYFGMRVFTDNLVGLGLL